MDHIKILKRAWEIVWRYRVLWIFGIILALTTAGGGFSGNYGSGGGGGGNGGPAEYHFDEGDFFLPDISPQMVTTLIAVGILLLCVILFLTIVATAARYVAETALIRMVDDYEETGEKRSVRQGFRLGWSRTALRFFLIDLLINVPLAFVLGLLFALSLAPLLLWITKSTAAGVIGTIAAVGMFFLTLSLAILIGVALRLLKPFFRRACALEELGVIEAIRQGLSVVRRRWQDALVMWLIMVGVSIGWMIAMALSAILLFPVIILLIVVGGIAGGIPAALVFGLTSLLFDGAAPWILAAVVGLPIFILVLSVPWIFLGGLMEVFKSSVWTLTYRELRVLEGLETKELPETNNILENRERDDDNSQDLYRSDDQLDG